MYKLINLEFHRQIKHIEDNCIAQELLPLLLHYWKLLLFIIFQFSFFYLKSYIADIVIKYSKKSSG